LIGHIESTGKTDCLPEYLVPPGHQVKRTTPGELLAQTAGTKAMLCHAFMAVERLQFQEHVIAIHSMRYHADNLKELEPTISKYGSTGVPASAFKIRSKRHGTSANFGSVCLKPSMVGLLEYWSTKYHTPPTSFYPAGGWMFVNSNHSQGLVNI